MKTHKIGSISTGTLRTEDLLSTFASTLERLILINGDYFAKPENFSERDRLNALVGEAQDAFGDDGETLTEEGETNGPEIVDSLIDALQEFAPSFCTFGAHVGDGADFGFWPDVDAAREGVEFVSFKNHDAARRAGVETDKDDPAYPAPTFRGEWLHVNDHGNATLYLRTGHPNAPLFTDRELWSVV